MLTLNPAPSPANNYWPTTLPLGWNWLKTSLVKLKASSLCAASSLLAVAQLLCCGSLCWDLHYACLQMDYQKAAQLCRVELKNCAFNSESDCCFESLCCVGLIKLVYSPGQSCGPVCICSFPFSMRFVVAWQHFGQWIWILEFRKLAFGSSPVVCVTSKSLATRYLLFGVPLARKRDPRSAWVSRPTFTNILWHSTSMSSSLATSRISSMKSSPSSNSIKWRRLSGSACTDELDNLRGDFCNAGTQKKRARER